MHQREIRRQHRAVPAPEECGQDQRDVRENRQNGHQQECTRRHDLHDPFRRTARTAHRSFHRGRSFGRTQEQTRQQIHHQRQHQHDDDQRVGQGIGLQFRDAVEDLHRGGPRAAEHQRRAQFRETPDQHDASPGQNARFQQRQGDPRQPLPFRGSQIRRRFIHRRIDIPQRRHQIQIQNRVQVQCHDDAYRPEPAVPAQKIDPRSPQRGHDRVDHSVMPQNLLEPQRSHERRQDHRQHHHQTAQALPRKFIAVIQQRQRQGDHKDQQRGHHRDPERIPQPQQIDFVFQDFPHQVPAQSFFHYREHRQDQEQREKRQQKETAQDLYQFHHDHFPSRASSAALRY